CARSVSRAGPRLAGATGLALCAERAVATEGVRLTLGRAQGESASRRFAAVSTPAPRWYFVHPWIDALCAGGLSILAFAGAAAVSSWAPSLAQNQTLPSVLTVVGLLQWFINWPHFSATCYRLLRVPENRREFP